MDIWLELNDVYFLMQFVNLLDLYTNTYAHFTKLC